MFLVCVRMKERGQLLALMHRSLAEIDFLHCIVAVFAGLVPRR